MKVNLRSYLNENGGNSSRSDRLPACFCKHLARERRAVSSPIKWGDFLNNNFPRTVMKFAVDGVDARGVFREIHRPCKSRNYSLG